MTNYMGNLTALLSWIYYIFHFMKMKLSSLFLAKKRTIPSILSRAEEEPAWFKEDLERVVWNRVHLWRDVALEVLHESAVIVNEAHFWKRSSEWRDRKNKLVDLFHHVRTHKLFILMFW